MLKELTRFNPLGKLRLRIGLVVVGAITALAVFLSGQFSERLTSAYDTAGQAQLRAIAGTWDDGFRGIDLRRPEALQRRLDRLRANNPTLHKISVSWHDRRAPDPAEGDTMIVQSGHEHDPDGAKRDITTSQVQRYTNGTERAPIDAPRWGYREVRARDGAHYGELNYPVKRLNETVAAMELHYDLKTLDQTLARDKRTLAIASALAAITLSLFVNFLMGRSVLTPLQQLRKATQRIKNGEITTRLAWRRSDEIGVLARDFDAMAEELQSVHAHLEVLALKDPLTGLLNHRAFQERMAEELRRAEREATP